MNILICVGEDAYFESEAREIYGDELVDAVLNRDNSDAPVRDENNQKVYVGFDLED